MSSGAASGLGIIGKYAGSAASETAAFAAGAAISPALSPLLQKLRNETWSKYPDVPPDAYVLAAGVAQGQVDPKAAKAWAAENGIGPAAWTAIVNVANVGPALSYAFEAWRRGFLTDAEFQTALHRTGLEPQWYAAMKALKTQLVDLATIANGIQRGLIDAPFKLPYNPQPGPGKIEPFPTVNVDPVATVEGLGYTEEDLKLEVGLAGNPPGPEALYRAQFRGAIDPNDVIRGLVEGRARAEWAPAFEADARAIPSPVNYVEALVRDWIPPDQMIAGVARHGMTPEDAQILFLIHGRPLTHAQVFIAKLRGGVYDGPTDMIDVDFLKSLRESDMRPEWYNLAWHARYHFPPFFQTINALSKGWIDAPTATQWLLWQAYDPDAVRTIVANVAGGGKSTGKKLTPTQIRSAYRDLQITRDDALQRLQADGYSATDANVLLGPAPATA